MKVLHIITGLNRGGAETCLFRHLAAQDGRSAHEVISLLPAGALEPAIAALGVRVRSLPVRTPASLLCELPRLGAWITRSRPDIVHTWMYHANLAGILANSASLGAPLIASIHHANLDPEVNKPSTLCVARAGAYSARLARVPVVFVSQAGFESHLRLGYDAGASRVIPNGFDTSSFRPDPLASAALRRHAGIGRHATVIGVVSRFDPIKGLETLAAAIRIVLAQGIAAAFVFCGAGLDADNPELLRLLRRYDATFACRLLGPRADIAALMSGFDLFCSPSHGEAFPTAIGEAMSCGIPCVATGVGDTALITGDTGIIVPPRDPAALAAGLLRMIRLGPQGRRPLSLLARRRIEQRFTIGRSVAAYDDLYRATVAGRVHAPKAA